jgi:hypothetical protein
MSLITECWEALNQTPISLDLPKSARGLSPEAFLRAVLKAAAERCGASKNVVGRDFKLSLNYVPDPAVERQRRLDQERRYQERKDAAAVSNAVEGFCQMVGIGQKT